MPLMPLLCREYPGHLGYQCEYLQAACDELCTVYRIMAEEPREMSREAHQRMCRAMTRHLSFWGRCVGDFIPKHHYAWHLVEQAGSKGNPRWYWTYADEGENRAMSRVASSLHQGGTFYNDLCRECCQTSLADEPEPDSRCTFEDPASGPEDH